MIYFRSQVRPFVLLFEGRTGSTFLTETLGQHPAVLAMLERFPGFIKAGQGAAGQLAWADMILTPPIVGRYKARGFKTKLRDIADPEGFARLVNEKEAVVLHMHRRNRIKKTVSYFTGRQLNQATNNWNLYEESKRPGAFRLDVAAFDAALQEREEWDRQLDGYVQRLGRPTMVVYYEDMLQDQRAFLEQVFGFLGVRYRPVKANSFKNTKDDLREVLLNFEEVRGHYVGTGYEGMFDEVVKGDA